MRRAPGLPYPEPARTPARKEAALSPDTIAIIVATIGAAGALAGAILPGQYAMRRDVAGIHRDIAGLHRDIGDLRERMARLEGLFEGFTRRESAPPPPA